MLREFGVVFEKASGLNYAGGTEHISEGMSEHVWIIVFTEQDHMFLSMPPASKRDEYVGSGVPPRHILTLVAGVATLA